MVTSHFLHAYIVVQPDPEDDSLYRVAVTARYEIIITIIMIIE